MKRLKSGDSEELVIVCYRFSIDGARKYSSGVVIETIGLPKVKRCRLVFTITN